MDVAVKKAFISPCAGRIPTSENGMAAMMIIGVRNDWNQPTTSTYISTSTGWRWAESPVG
jgi:hypothetical protein